MSSSPTSWSGTVRISKQHQVGTSGTWSVQLTLKVVVIITPDQHLAWPGPFTEDGPGARSWRTTQYTLIAARDKVTTLVTYLISWGVIMLNFRLPGEKLELAAPASK
jgi:hypothetical protein